MPTKPSKYALPAQGQARERRPRGRVGPRPRPATASPFGFVQLEFGFLLGPPDGRYLVRSTADAPWRPCWCCPRSARRSARGSALAGLALSRPRSPRRCPRRAPRSSRPAPSRRPAAWLAELDRDAEVDGAVAVLNRALRAHRAATADPYVAEVSRDRALVVRLGYGSGDEVADGRYGEAMELPRRGRVA